MGAVAVSGGCGGRGWWVWWQWEVGEVAEGGGCGYVYICVSEEGNARELTRSVVCDRKSKRSTIVVYCIQRVL